MTNSNVLFSVAKLVTLKLTLFEYRVMKYKEFVLSSWLEKKMDKTICQESESAASVQFIRQTICRESLLFQLSSQARRLSWVLKRLRQRLFII